MGKHLSPRATRLVVLLLVISALAQPASAFLTPVSAAPQAAPMFTPLHQPLACQLGGRRDCPGSQNPNWSHIDQYGNPETWCAFASENYLWDTNQGCWVLPVPAYHPPIVNANPAGADAVGRAYDTDAVCANVSAKVFCPPKTDCVTGRYRRVTLSSPGLEDVTFRGFLRPELNATGGGYRIPTTETPVIAFGVHLVIGISWHVIDSSFASPGYSLHEEVRVWCAE